MDSPQKRRPIERVIKARNAEVYAGFLVPYLRPGMAVLDCGCGEATITLGLAEAVHAGWVAAIDLDEDSFAAGALPRSLDRSAEPHLHVSRGAAASFFRRGVRRCSLRLSVLSHSMIETLGDPPGAVAELRRVAKPGGVVGAASVEYGGIIIGGRKTAGPYRFYDTRQRLWRAERKWTEQTRLSSAAVVAWAVGPRSANHRNPVLRILE